MRKVHVILACAIVILTVGTARAEKLGLNYEKFESFSTSASQASGDGAAHKGMIILQPDFNLGGHGGFGGNFSYRGFFVPGFTFNAEFGVHDYVSVGPYVGFGGRNNFMTLGVGARAVFHWWQLLDDKVSGDLLSDKIDFYFPFHVGVNMGRVKGYKWDAGASAGGGLGFRYYFVDQFGVNLEWGWMEMSYAKFGLTVKLN